MPALLVRISSRPTVGCTALASRCTSSSDEKSAARKLAAPPREATFYGPKGETRTIGKNEGVLLPHGTLYWFKATSDEPLVMVRIGAAAFDGVDRHGRMRPGRCSP